MQNIKAFTLMELLIVVLIIGILAAIALPSYQRSVDMAHYTQALTLLETILQAEDLYKMTNGNYTTRFDELDVEMPTPKNISDGHDIYYYNWGNCCLHNTGYVACKINLGNAHVWAFSYPGRNNKSCWVQPSNDKRGNVLCQSVTKNPTASSDGNYNIYSFLK